MCVRTALMASKNLLCSICIGPLVCSELLSRLPRNLLCSLHRSSASFTIRYDMFLDSLKEGPSKASLFHLLIILHKGSAREGFSNCPSLSSIFQMRYQKPTGLQGFTLRGQYFFSRAQQGLSMASLSLFKPSSQGPCKVCMTESNLSLLC